MSSNSSPTKLESVQWFAQSLAAVVIGLSLKVEASVMPDNLDDREAVTRWLLDVSKKVGDRLNTAPVAASCATGTEDAPKSWELEDYRARLLAVSAILCEPVSPKNLRDARELIAPLYVDALAAVKAKRTSESLGGPASAARETANDAERGGP